MLMLNVVHTCKRMYYSFLIVLSIFKLSENYFWNLSIFDIGNFEDFCSRIICMGDFNFNQSNILTQQLYFYSSMTFG